MTVYLATYKKGIKMRKSNELQIGKAGEYLVCCDLIMKGFIAFPSEQGLPYDVLLDTGKKILKVQVKTTSGVRVVPQRKTESKMYIFNVKKHGKNNLKRYSKKEVDLFAIVSLATMQAGYLITDDMPETINVRADELRGFYYDEKGAEDYKSVIRLREKGLNQTETAKEVGIAVATVSRMCAKGYKPFLTKARYFSDFLRHKEWFYGI